MVFKGEYKVKYTLDRKQEELVVRVELKQREGILKPRQSIYYGEVIVNGSLHEEIEGCVNAQHCAEGVALKLIEEYKAKANAEDKSFRVKRK